MRITKKTILAIGLIASSHTLNSCDDNDNNEVSQRPTALVTVYPSAPDGFFIPQFGIVQATNPSCLLYFP